MKKKGVSRARLVIFSVAVAFISVFFFAYAVQAVYPAPDYEDFCPREIHQKQVLDEEACVAEGGRWTDYEKDALNMDIRGWCEVDYTCQMEYEEVREPYERNVFFANLGIGVLLLIGAFFLGVEAISTGLMGGAVMLIFYGTVRYWGELSDVWRTLMLGVALAVLIYLGYKKLAD
ncbi:hypothetical protein HNV12_01860 [Methanococcoides sp. SA1]|nr:hypothetical protein [Methanococcoides sp. SA1]